MNLPLIGESDMLYKVLADEKFILGMFHWYLYAIESVTEAKTSVVVVEILKALPEEGE